MKILIVISSVILLASAKLNPDLFKETHDLSNDAKQLHSFVTEMILDNIEEGKSIFDAELASLKEELEKLTEKITVPEKGIYYLFIFDLT